MKIEKFEAHLRTDILMIKYSVRSDFRKTDSHYSTKAQLISNTLKLIRRILRTPS